ncbi:SRPBCC family protein [Frankia sp. Ag45/Mut15]|uniref:SRPBCC family protein n=1 Tax=Frankia umida TaxID=573489 RepID=A0ABT0JSX3_9ACTN|nr:SRPBCC family protein [Frankia umida]MCK9874636.1 SRPBCC family protein [Frankia umida]
MTLLTEVREVLVDMDIDGEAEPATSLRDELGMDSQEIVHLLSSLARGRGVDLPDGSNRVGSIRSIQDVVELLAAALDRPATPEQTGTVAAPRAIETIDDAPTLAYRCRTSAVIRRPKAVVYQALHDMAAWPTHLPHVLEIDVRYDDGQYQEFHMAVDSPTGMLRVRSIRNCQPDLIEWFQPEPPHFLAHHGGTWRFQDTPEGFCEITATHAWNLEPTVASTTFPPTPQRSTADAVTEMLLDHANLAISTWRAVLEGATGQPATLGTSDAPAVRSAQPVGG